MTLTFSTLCATVLASTEAPNEQALALSPTLAWWLYACALCVFALFFVQGDRWRRWWLRTEDPRSIGLFRIAFAFFVICNMNDFWEYFRMLFTNEGIFTTDVVQSLHASNQFKGYGTGLVEGEPAAFFDWDAFWLWAKGPKYSLLYFWDSPAFFWCHLIAFELITVLFMLGLWSRVTGVLSFFGMMSIFYRNHLFWEGTEVVYITMFVYLLCAKSGHAYSLDNWLRCRKLRRRGLLSTRDGPGGGAGVAPSEDHPGGLQAVYRWIPAWPRRLMMLQLATIMITTGLLKNGHVWGRGDAVYYAWNLDHFYRFYPQQISSIIGTNLLRLSTHVAHFGEIFFAFIIVGVIVRFAHQEPALKPWQRWGVRLSWAALVLCSMMVVVVAWPVHITQGYTVEWFVIPWLLLWTTIWVITWYLGHKQPKVTILGRRYTLDREWLRKWTVGRRIWMIDFVLVMGGIFVLMNIGQFQTVMLTCLLVFLEGDEVARGLRWIGRRLPAWVPGIPVDVRRGEPPLPLEDPSLPHLKRDASRLPSWAILVIAGAVFGGVALLALKEPKWPWVRIWIGGLALAYLVSWYTGRAARQRRLPAIHPETGRADPPWAYGPWGRLLVGAMTIWHLVAVATWLMPDKDICRDARNPARQWFGPWMSHTYTSQGWGMFAPNPPRANVFLKVVVYDADGEPWDLKTDLYAAERWQIPFIWNDRMRKMNRRLVGKGSMYRKWYARWHCREWQRTHNGEIPDRVELIKYTYVIPTPEQVATRGWYRPLELMKTRKRESTVHTETCVDAIMGQLSNEDRARYDLPPLPEGVEYKPWIQHKLRKWERHIEAERRKAERARQQREHPTRRAPPTKASHTTPQTRAAARVGNAARGGE